MRSIKNIKRICNGDLYISVSISKAIELQNKGIQLRAFNNLKSIFVKEIDLQKAGVEI